MRNRAADHFSIMDFSLSLAFGVVCAALESTPTTTLGEHLFRVCLTVGEVYVSWYSAIWIVSYMCGGETAEERDARRIAWIVREMENEYRSPILLHCNAS